MVPIVAPAAAPRAVPTAAAGRPQGRGRIPAAAGRWYVRRVWDVSYSCVGMTAADGPPPAGFRELRVRTRLPAGGYEQAARALFGWRMHRGTPFLHVPAGTPPAAPGVRVGLRMGPVHAPCQVVWTLTEQDRTGFAYGTLPGHPECGEESFLLRRHPDGSADLTIRAVSRPAAWYVRAAGPLGPLAQRAVARQYARSLRRACAPTREPRAAPPGPPT